LADRQADRKSGPVAAPGCDLPTDADDFLVTSGEIARDIAVVLVAVRRRHQDADVLADGFFLAIAEHPLRRRIERFDAPVRIDDDDPVDCRFDHRSPTLLAGAKALLECTLFAAVVHANGSIQTGRGPSLCRGGFFELELLDPVADLIAVQAEQRRRAGLVPCAA